MFEMLVLNRVCIHIVINIAVILQFHCLADFVSGNKLEIISGERSETRV